MPPAPNTRRGLFTEVVHLQQTGHRGALATPLWFSGSVPLRSQSRLLLRDDGSMLGTIGGGLLEAHVLEAAREVLTEGSPRVLEFNLAGDEAARSGMICGGRCAVLVEPVRRGVNEAVFHGAAHAEATHARAVIITLLPEDGSIGKLILTPEGELIGATMEDTITAAVRKAAEESVEHEAPQFLTEPVRAHFDPLLPRPTAYIFGGGHIGVVTAHLAHLVGFRVIVIDDREDFANRERFPTADEVWALPVAEAFAQLPFDDASYLVTVTRGHAQDEDVLVEALRTSARYIGMIGSRRKVAGVFARLRARGFSDDDIARVHAPIGLNIEAETVEEIAVSIVAELIAVRRGKV